VARGGGSGGVTAKTPARGRHARQSPHRDRLATEDLPISRATNREVGVVAAVLAAGSDKAAVHRLGHSHSTVKRHLANGRSTADAPSRAQLAWILAPRLPEPEGRAHMGRVAGLPDGP
jgi:DNA-binding NarL/FixJ family response regulator